MMNKKGWKPLDECGEDKVEGSSIICSPQVKAQQEA